MLGNFIDGAAFGKYFFLFVILTIKSAESSADIEYKNQIQNA